MLRRALALPLPEVGNGTSPPSEVSEIFVRRLWSEGPGPPCGLCAGFSPNSRGLNGL